jgi:2-aminoadipate transaminase
MTSRERDWSSTFAARSSVESGGALNEILRLANVQGVISFAGGFPDPETFPREALLDGFRDLVSGIDSAPLQYSPVAGLPGPRDFVSSRIERNDGRRPSPEEMLLTSGGIEALQLVNQTLVDPGDVVLIEGPTYLGAIMSFRSFGAELRTVPMDEGGLMTDELEKLLLGGIRPKLVYTIPDHQNPMGATLGLDRRRHLVELARTHGFLIVEDVAYRELYFEHEPVASFWALAPDVSVQIGTFSKTFLPGFRLGWAAGPAKLIAGLINAKQLTDQCAGALGQSLLEWYGRSGHMDSQVARSRALYQRRRDLLIEALEQNMPSHVRWTRPEGGFFAWLTLGVKADTTDLAAKARERGVAFVPGAPFYAKDQGHEQLRLSYSCVADSDIADGVQRLAQLFRESVHLTG